MVWAGLFSTCYHPLDFILLHHCPGKASPTKFKRAIPRGRPVHGEPDPENHSGNQGHSKKKAEVLNRIYSSKLSRSLTEKRDHCFVMELLIDSEGWAYSCNRLMAESIIKSLSVQARLCPLPSTILSLTKGAFTRFFAAKWALEG